MHIETPRLIIREFEPNDAAALFEMDRDPEVHKYLGNTPYTNIQQSRTYIKKTREQYATDGISRWALINKTTGELIGRTGFKLIQENTNGHVNYYDFGFRNRRKYWRKGYAFEAAQAALNYGINTLKLKDIYAMTHVDNTGTAYLLRKLGFEYVETFTYSGEPPWPVGVPVLWFQLNDTNYTTHHHHLSGL